jgi:phosphatidate cytidylyltransferase
LAVAFGSLWLAGTWEWTRFTGIQRLSPVVYSACFVVLMVAMGPLFDAQSALLVAVIAIAWWVLPSILLWSYPRGLSRAFVTIAGPLTLIPAWFLLSYLHGSGPQGPGLTLSLLLIIWAADVGAYLFGRRIGRVKLAPTISPGKTWEGVVGGVVSAALAAAVTGFVLEVPLGAFVAAALAATLVSVIGDLTVSMYKRNVGLKDSGRLLPGHGGVLDRIDSLSAAVPIFFVGLHIAGL